jgi:hypothetical protein
MGTDQENDKTAGKNMKNIAYVLTEANRSELITIQR